MCDTHCAQVRDSVRKAKETLPGKDKLVGLFVLM